MRWGIGAGNRLSAEQRRRLDKVRLEKIKSDADETKELAELEARAYQAEVDAQVAQDKAKQLRRQAGHLTMGERLTGVIQGGGGGSVSRIAGSIGNALSGAARNLLTPDDEPKSRAKRTTAKRKSATAKSTRGKGSR